jgi:hypothetical protein
MLRRPLTDLRVIGFATLLLTGCQTPSHAPPASPQAPPSVAPSTTVQSLPWRMPPATCTIGSSAPNLVPLAELGPDLVVPEPGPDAARVQLTVHAYRVVSGTCAPDITSARGVGIVLNNNFWGGFGNPERRFQYNQYGDGPLFGSDPALTRLSTDLGRVIYAAPSAYDTGFGIIAAVQAPGSEWLVVLFRDHDGARLRDGLVLLRSRAEIISTELTLAGYQATDRILTVTVRQSNQRVLIAGYDIPGDVDLLAR